MWHHTAATCSDGSEFNRYVMPTEPISAEATHAIGLAVRIGQLLYNERVDTVSASECLMAFIAYLESKNAPLCIGHNIRAFDCPILIHHLLQNDLLKESDDVICGFADSLSLYKHLLPDRKTYKQEDLVSDVISQAYDAHNAMADVAALKQLVEGTDVPHEVLECVTSSVSSADMFMYNNQKSRNCETLQQLVAANALKESKDHPHKVHYWQRMQFFGGKIISGDA